MELDHDVCKHCKHRIENAFAGVSSIPDWFHTETGQRFCHNLDKDLYTTAEPRENV